MNLSDILLYKLTDVKYVSRYLKTNYSVPEFIKYIKDNRYNLLEWYHAYNGNDYRGNSKSVDDFCIFLLTRVKKTESLRKPYTVGNNEYGTYEPEGFFLNNTTEDKKYWHPVSETTMDPRNWRRLHIYHSPYYTDQEFLPSQYTGHYRPYANAYLARGSETIQDTSNSSYPVTNYKSDEPVIPKFNWLWYGGPTPDVELARRYRTVIPPQIYQKIIYGKPISVFEYNALTKMLPPDSGVELFADNIMDNKWALYKYADINYNPPYV